MLDNDDAWWYDVVDQLLLCLRDFVWAVLGVVAALGLMRLILLLA